MSNLIVTAGSLLNALRLYLSLPAAILFRGNTGYGFVETKEGADKVGLVASCKGIWKPMYVSITGGEKWGKTVLNAAQIQTAVEEFKINPLAAVLRTTTGKGLRLNDAGMVELTDARNAVTPVKLEVTHYGGRSILTTLVVELAEYTAVGLEWQSGFTYESPGNKPVKVGEPIELTRFLLSEDYASDKVLERVWSDVVKEANRVTMFNTDGTLPRVRHEADDQALIVLSQELTKLLPNVQIDGRQQGVRYNVRRDGVVELSTVVPRHALDADTLFAKRLQTFVDECNRVAFHFCQPLTEQQKKMTGKPNNEVFGQPEIAQVSWQKSQKGDDQIIAFHEDNRKPIFPAEGWDAKTVKNPFVLLARKGNGYTAYPAPAQYLNRYAQKDDAMAEHQLVRVEFDGAEKVVTTEDVKLAQGEWKFEEGDYWTSRLEKLDDGAWAVIQSADQYWRLKGEKVQQEHSKDFNGKPITKIVSDVLKTEVTPIERRLAISTKVRIEPHKQYQDDDLKAKRLKNHSKWDRGWCVMAEAVNPKGETVTAMVKNAKGEYKLGWDELPEEFRKALVQEWPMCQCGRQRYEKATSDRCYTCLNYRHCAGCGKLEYFGEKKIAEAAATGQPLLYGQCETVARVFDVVAEVFGPEHLDRLAAEASTLLAASQITDNPELAPTVLQTIVERQLPESWQRPSELDRAIQNARAAFKLDTGYFASSRFGVEALQKIATLPTLSALEVLGVLAYVLGVNSSWENSFSGSDATAEVWRTFAGRRLLEGKNVLAEKVAEPDAVFDQLKAEVENLKLDVAEIIEENEEVVSDDFCGQELRDLSAHMAKGQFAEARIMIEKINEILDRKKATLITRQERIDRGEIWPSVFVSMPTDNTSRYIWVFDPDGNEVEPLTRKETGGRKSRVYGYFYGDVPTDHVVVWKEHDTYGYRKSERWGVDYKPQHITPAQLAKIQEKQEETRTYFVGPGTGWDLSKASVVSYTVPHSRKQVPAQYQAAYDEMRQGENGLTDVSKWEVRVGDDMYNLDGVNVVWFYKKSNPYQKLIDEAEQAYYSAYGELMSLEVEARENRASVEEAGAQAKLRLTADPGTVQVAVDTILLVEEIHKETYRGEEGWVAGPFLDEPSGEWVKVKFPHWFASTANLTEGMRDVLVKVHAKNPDQLVLFVDRLEVGEGENKKTVKVYGVFGEAILSQDAISPKIVELKTAVANAEATLKALEEKQRLHKEAESKKQSTECRAADVPDERRPTRKTVETVIDYSREENSSFATFGDALAGAVQVVETSGESGQAVTIPQNVLKPGGETTFEFAGRRDFQCQRQGCGAFVPLTSSEMKAYKAGTLEKQVECPKCKASGIVQLNKATEIVAK